MSGEGPSRDTVGAADLASVVETVDRLVDDVMAAARACDLGSEPVEWGPSAADDVSAYRRWLDEYDRMDHARAAGPSTEGPTVSVAIRLDGPDPGHLDGCLRSVIDQSYRNWRLVLHVVGCLDPEADAVIDGYLVDQRVTIRDAGDVAPTMSAAHADRRSDDDLVLQLGAEDILAHDALALLAGGASSADVDIVYSDEDGLDDTGGRCRPVFKPDWDPDLLLAYPYLGDAIAVRRSLLDGLGIALPLAPCDRYDFELRITEAARVIRHVPEVLYHARTPRFLPDGLAGDAEHGTSRAHRALESAIVRRGIVGSVESGARAGWYAVRPAVDPAATVSVIIPFRDQATLTRACVESLERNPGHRVHEVVLVDNGSTEPETHVLRRLLEQKSRTRVVDFPEPFNWAAINNAAAAVCTGDLLLFLNNDIEAKSDGWLRALVEQAQRPDVGAAGARLVYGDGSLQHIGVVLGIQGLAAHLFAGMPPGMTGYLGWDRVIRSWTAVTGACMLVRRQVFDELGGFDEGYPVAFNDVDFCLRLGSAGYRVVSTPYAELTHFESVSRGFSGYGRDLQRFLARWGDEVRGDDPRYSRNLSRNNPWCGLRQPDEDERWCSTVDSLVQPVSEDAPEIPRSDERA